MCKQGIHFDRDVKNSIALVVISYCSQILELFQFQKKSQYKIGQICMAGSVGKKTTIMGSDMDCVLFINDEMPPFEDILDEFEDILTLSTSFNIRNVRKTRYSVQFSADEFDFDILPAPNMVKKEIGSDDDEDLVALQQARVLDVIKRNPEKYSYMYSGGLAFSAIRFMKQQDDFAHDMVRLAKFWYKSLYFPQYISGAKALIEMVAVFAAQKEKKFDSKSHLRCLATILEQLLCFDNLNVVFEEELQKLASHNQIGNQRPRVIEPANPYNNLAQNWSKEIKALIQTYAAETRRRLDYMCTARNTNIWMLFEPQPRLIPNISKVLPNSKWAVGSGGYAVLPGKIIRNESLLKKEGFSGALQLIQQCFEILWIALMAMPEMNVRQWMTSFENAINVHVKNQPNSQWGPSHGKHEDFDITFTFPIGGGQSLSVSLSVA